MIPMNGVAALTPNFGRVQRNLASPANEPPDLLSKAECVGLTQRTLSRRVNVFWRTNGSRKN